MPTAPSFEFRDHVLDARDRLDLIGMGRLEILHQRALRQPAKNGEIVHLVARQHGAGVIAVVDADRRAVDNVIGVARLAVLALQHLQPRSPVRLEPEIVGLVMAGFVRQTVGVVLVAREARPAPPEPGRDLDKPFLMPIEDIFSIQGRGTVVTGRIERGMVSVNDEMEIVGIKDTEKTTCTGVEMFRKLLDEGRAGENVGVLLRGTKREEVERGQVLSKPGSITTHTKFEAQVYVLNKEEGGRHTPFFKGYRPQFYVRTTDVTGEVILPDGVEMVMPGDDVAINVELISPIAMEEGMRFAIREGGRTVGSGVVSKIVQ